MARRKVGFFGLLVVMVLSIVAGAYVGYNYLKKDEPVQEQPNGDSTVTGTWLTVIETNVEYRQGSTSLDLVKGVIKTNEQVDKIFVNVNGFGAQELEFTPSLIQTTDNAYYANNITAIDGLCSVLVDAKKTVTVDLYVEYGGRSFKVDTQEIEVIEEIIVDTPDFAVLSADIEYGQNSTTIDLIRGVIQTNAQVDKIFVNVNGVGTQYVTFTEDIAIDNAYYEYNINAVNGLCATSFGNDGTVTVDVYVEYGGRSYKVDAQAVSVRSCWTKNY